MSRRPRTAPGIHAPFVTAILVATLVATGCDDQNVSGPSLVIDNVEITSPRNGFMVVGTSTIRTEIERDQEPVSVDLFIDGTRVAADSTEPWTFSWDTTSLDEGSEHQLEVTAIDAEGRIRTSDAVTVFVGEQTFSGDYGLFTINADGTNLRQIAVLDIPGILPIAPDISPDGSRLAFTGITEDLDLNGLILPGGDDPSSETFVANADGTNILQRTHNNEIEQDTRWVQAPGLATPSGLPLLYATDRAGVGANLDVFREQIMGGVTHNETGSLLGFSERYPSEIEPNELIYHTRFLAGDEPGVGEIWTVHRITSMFARVTSPAITGSPPSWLPLGDLAPDLSPDGLDLAFSRSRGGKSAGSTLGDVDVIVRSLADSLESDLSDNDVADLYPRWSPDGSALLVTSWGDNLSDGGDLVILDPADGSRTVVGPLPLELRPIQASWYPDATFDIDDAPDIIFAGARTTKLE